MSQIPFPYASTPMKVLLTREIVITNFGFWTTIAYWPRNSDPDHRESLNIGDNKSVNLYRLPTESSMRFSYGDTIR